MGIWRGSFSSCRTPRCRIKQASGREKVNLQEMEACGRLAEGELVDCTWNTSTWLKMARGRLVWLSRIHTSVDAKFVPSHNHPPMDSELEQLLRDEHLLAEPIP